MFSLFRNESTSDIVDNITDAISSVLGDDLQSLILFGSDSGGESPADPDDSNATINLLVVVPEVSLAILDRLAESVQNIRGHKRLIPRVVTIEDLYNSDDVFPIALLDMKRNYRVLSGEDVLRDLSIIGLNLRLRCEQELRGLSGEMQGNYLGRAHNLGAMSVAFRSNYLRFVRAIGASLLLSGRDWPFANAQVLAAAADVYGLNTDVIHRVSQAYEGHLNLEGDLITSVYGSLMNLVQQSVIAIDLETEQTASNQHVGQCQESSGSSEETASRD